MEIRFKRFLSLAMAIIMVVSMMPANIVFATENEESQSQQETVPETSECTHTETTKTTVAATCVDAGSETVTCNACNVVVSTKTIDALGHSYVDGEVTLAATCTAVGQQAVTCASCDYSGTKELPMVAHSYVDGDVTLAATCTAVGQQAVTCANCDYSGTKELPMVAHNYVDGACSVCGAKDPEMEKPVEETQAPTEEATEPPVAKIDVTECGDDDHKYTADSDACTVCGHTVANVGKGYKLFLLNGDGTVALAEDASRSGSAFCVRTALEDARVFADNPWMSGVTGKPSFVIFMYEDSTEDKSFTIGEDVTINGNGHKIVCAEGVTVTNKGILNNAEIVETKPACEHPTHGTDGKCTVCDETVEHTYTDGKCTVCGADDPNYEEPATEVTVSTLAELVNALADNSNDLPIVVTETITIPAGETVTLNLNGKTIIATDNKAANVSYELFYIYGGLTVTGNGTIELTSTSNDTSWAKSSTIFHNRGGVLVIQSGTFTHKGGTAMAYVVDNNANSYGDATTTIKGGNLSSTYIAIRNRMDTYGANGGGNGVATLNIEGGSLSGKYAVWGQVASAGCRGNITITGGNFTAAAGKATVVVDEDTTGEIVTAIYGGTFTSDVSEFLADGYVQNENGTVTAAPSEPEAPAVAEVDTQEELLAALANGGTVKLIGDISTTTSESDETDPYLYIMTGDDTVLDLNGHKITPAVYPYGDDGTYAILICGDLTITDTSDAGNGSIFAAKEGYLSAECTYVDGIGWTDPPVIIINGGTVNNLAVDVGTSVVVNGGNVKLYLYQPDYFYEQEEYDAYLASLTLRGNFNINLPEGYELKNGTVVKIAKPPVVVPDKVDETVAKVPENSSVTLDQAKPVVEAAVAEMEQNSAISKVTENVPENAEFIVELKSVEVDQINEKVVPTKLVFHVAPMQGENKVQPDAGKSITFRLPVPSSVTKTHAKVYHGSDLMGTYAIEGEGNAKYIEVSSASFSEFAAVFVDAPVTPAYVAQIGDQKYETLDAALNAAKTMTGDVTIEIYDKVTLKQPLNGNYSSIKFVGKEEDAEIYLDVQGYTTATGKRVFFEDLKLSKTEGGYVANAGFMNLAFGIYDVAEVTYTNCTFLNGACASFGKVTFNGCTFYRSYDRYGLWAYGAADVVVDGCTFDDIRGIKLFSEGKKQVTDLTVKNTTFTEKVDGKPAIVLTDGKSVTLENNTYSSTGVFELDLEGKPNGTPVTFDVAPTCINDNGTCGVLVDGKIYTTVAQAAEVATSGSKVTLLHESTETVELPAGVVLDKNNFAAEGITVKQPAVAEVNGKKFESFESAVIYANQQTGTVNVTLLADVEFSGDDLYANMVLDLNGKTMTATGSYVFWFEGGSLVVKDSSTEKTGKIDGSATVNNAFLLMGEESLSIESGKIHAKNNVIYAYGDRVTVIVNGGELKSYIDSGNIFYLVGENDTITVNDGTFIGNVNPYADGLTIKGGKFTADVNAYCAAGLGAVMNSEGVYEIIRVDVSNAAAQIGDKYFLTLGAAINAAGANDTIIVLKDVTEELPTLKGKIVPANGSVTITATNADWLYLPYAFEIGEGVTLNIPAMFVYYTNGAVIKGNVVANALYLSNAGTKLTIHEPGSLTVNGETFIVRNMEGDTEAGIYIVGDNNDETIGLKAPVIYFYQGMINAKDANIQVGTYWQTQTTDAGAYANAGSANLVLDNSKLNVTVNDHDFKATGNSTVTLRNGSSVTVNKGYEGVNVTMEDTSSFTKNGVSIFQAKVNNVAYTTLADAIAAAESGATVTLLADVELTATATIDKTVTLDLNGHKISGTKTAAVYSSLIHVANTGALTVKNSTGEGKISYAAGVGGAEGAVIWNEGDLVLESGTLETTGTWSIGYAVDVRPNAWGSAYTNKDVTFVMNGGKIKTSDAAIRVANDCSDGYADITVSFTMNGGEINSAATGIFIQQLTPIYDDLKVIIKGGAITASTAPIRFQSENAPTSYRNGTNGSALTIEGGSITAGTGGSNYIWAVNGMVRVSGKANVADQLADADITVSKTFAQSNNVLADGYKWAEKDGAYVLTACDYVAQIGTDGAKFESLADAIAAAQTGDTVTLLDDVSMSTILTINKAITLDGNSKKLTSTAGRAINVETDSAVEIKNLTIAAGERAINIINKPAKVTVDNVTATASNNAIMIATSAGAVNLSVNNSNLTGLAVVNVSGAAAQVEINNTTLTNKDANDKETYGAITVWSTAAGAKVTVSGGNINVEDDSQQAFVFPADATVEGVADVAYIVATIGDGGFLNLKEAIDYAKAGQTITLIRNVTASEIITIDKAITLDGNGKKLTSTATYGIDISTKASEEVTIKDLTIAGSAQRGINCNTLGTLNLNNVDITASVYALNLRAATDNCIVNISDSKLTGCIALNVWGENSKITATNTIFTSVDNTEAENYPAIALNNDGTNIATGCTIDIIGGKIIAKDENNAPSVAVRDSAVNNTVRISESTEVVGDIVNPVAIVTYVGYSQFYSCETLQRAIDKAIESNGTVKLIANITETSVTVNGNVTMELNGKNISGEIKLAANAVLTAPAGLNVTTVADHKVVYENGAYSVVECNYVAQVGEQKFESLQEAIDAANAGDTVTVLADIALDATVKIPAGKTITLELNGKTVSMVKDATVAAHNYMITNLGNLTVQDNVGGGKLSYEYVGADLATTYAANTITSEPGSVLTVKSGTIENLTYDKAVIAYAIDGRTNGSAGDVTINIEGGNITSKRQAVRIFANSTANTGALNISGGEFTGRVIIQNASEKANKAALNITGGVFNPNEYKSDVLYVGGSNSATIAINAAVNGGTFNGEITDTNVAGFISGGTFSSRPAAELLADGYEVVVSDGVYGVAKKAVVSGEARIGETLYATLADAINAANAAATAQNINILKNIDVKPAVTINAPMNIVTNGYALWNSAGVSALAEIVDTNSFDITDVMNLGMIFTITAKPQAAAPVAKIGETTYTTVEAALRVAQPGDTVVMVANSDESGVYLNVTEGVTLDLNGFTLKARSLAGFQNTDVYDSADSRGKNVLGKLVLPKGNLTLDENNFELPFWDDINACYVFLAPNTNSTYQYFKSGTVTDEGFTMVFRPSFGNIDGNSVLRNYMQNGAIDNEVTIKVRASWIAEDGTPINQTYTYEDAMVARVYTSGSFSITMYGLKNINTMNMNVIITTSSGVSYVGETLTYSK